MKILYVNRSVIGEKDATGQTLYHITKNMNNCFFKQYCIDYNPRYHTPTFDTIYESKFRNLLFFILKSIYRKFFSTKTSYQTLKTVTLDKPSFFSDFFKLFFDLLPHHISKNDLKQIQNFNPDAVYTLGGSITALKISYSICKKLHIPVVIHFMDDWYHTAYKRLPLLFFHLLLQKKTNKLLRYSYTNIAISPKMGQSYEKIFQKKFIFAMNCIDKTYQTAPHDHIHNFVFSGSLHDGRDRSLYQVGKVISSLSSPENPLSLTIFTSSNEIKQLGQALRGVALLKEYVPENLIFQNLSYYDCLIHVESFDKRTVSMFKYSLSTKIPEYLSLGKPILCFGPNELGTVEYIAQNHLGLCCSSLDSLRNCIKQITSDPVLVKEISLNAILEAKKSHLSVNVAAKVEKVFNDSVKDFQRERHKGFFREQK